MFFAFGALFAVRKGEILVNLVFFIPNLILIN